ncbi:MAG: OmpA family protein [Bdellovibrionia bacterium]
MLRRMSVAILAMAFIVGCKGKQTQTDEGVGGGAPGIDSAALSFDPMGSDSGKIAGLKTIFFPYDRSTLDETAKADLAANADWIKRNGNVRVQIEGHCDSRGTIEYNVALGERRANAVKTYLVGLGVPADRLAIISYGEAFSAR